MAQQTVYQEGAFTRTTKDIINDNFTELYASTAGGTLTSAHLLVGNGSNVATDTEITGDVAIDNAGVTSIADGITTHALTSGVAAGYKIARGATALDGSNPTPIATGLTTIVSAVATIQRTSAVSSGTAFVTVDFTGADGTLNVYAWVLAGSASTGTETINWEVVGT